MSRRRRRCIFAILRKASLSLLGWKTLLGRARESRKYLARRSGVPVKIRQFFKFVSTMLFNSDLEKYLLQLISLLFESLWRSFPSTHWFGMIQFDIELARQMLDQLSPSCYDCCWWKCSSWSDGALEVVLRLPPRRSIELEHFASRCQIRPFWSV